MARITVEAGYSDIYSDLYGGSAGDVLLSLEVAFNAPSETADWTDVSPYLRTASTRRGRSSELDAFSAGTATFVLDNRDRRFDPTYTSSPYYPDVLPMRRIRLSANYLGVVYPIFTGYVDGWPQEYQNPSDGFVPVHATDAFKVFSHQYVPSVWEQTIQADAPYAWWRMGDAINQSVMASSQGSHDGTYINDPDREQQSLLSFDGDKAVKFDGVSQYAQVSINLGKPFSIEFWVKADTTQPADDPDAEFPGNPTVLGYVTSTAQLLLYTNDSPLRFLVANRDASVISMVESSADVFDGGTHHVVVTYSSTAHKIYVDGVDVTTVVSGPDYTLFDSGLRAGTLTWGAFVLPEGNGFAGVLDEAIAYKAELTEEQAAAHFSAGATPWVGQTTGERIAAALAALDWSDGTDIATGNSTLTSANLNSDALRHMQDVALTEAGPFFIAADGTPTLIERHSFIGTTDYTTSQATFGDGAGELRYADIVFDTDDTQIRNDIRVTSPTFPQQTTEDADSIAAYLRRSYQFETLDATPAAMLDHADWILAQYKDPKLRVAELVVKPLREPTTLFPQVLGRELADLITTKRRPQGVGSAISQDVHIEAVSHDIDAVSQTWTAKWGLGPADEGDHWILEDAAEGLLDSTAVLSY